ncbi:family 65 glycosyl hydrolase [Bacillus shivajii]|uniref:glycoside hydrolase family 65 protein n=1 Tax=Bacillus shivajii TaxID=1983719 RepID=UPI001CFAFD27|nr:glycosyl hydrolase family 65 protein [Bacillus shivajii]UCZ52481.1 family 65 glycosyl hydrolase [Bacillus shivajii]
MVWSIKDTEIKENDLTLKETLFFLGNGYLGVRGNFEEGYTEDLKSIRGTYINAFHDRTDIEYGEKLHGFPDQQEKLLNIIDAQTVKIMINGEQFSLFDGEVLDYKRVLFFDKGYVERSVHWRSNKSDEVKVTFKRIVSFVTKELFALHVTVEPMNKKMDIQIVSNVNGNVTNYVDKNDPRIASGHAKRLNVLNSVFENGRSNVVDETYETKYKVAAASKTNVTGSSFEHDIQESQEAGITETYSFETSEPIEFQKFTIFTDTIRHGESLVEAGNELLDEVFVSNFDQLLDKQSEYLDQFWKISDIEIEGDKELQEGIRFNLYHLLQSVGKDEKSNIAAKGLSGEGYEGHYFWDTEIYMFPVFLMTNPKIAKNLLLNRYGILESAKERAKEVGHTKGALFPWRTINGGESSAFFPAGTAQYHISADIAYSFIQYYQVTKDDDFFKNYSAELLFETARLWMDTGHFHEGKFRIDDVTGPDEYTCIVNNNYYTNAMAKYNLEWAVKAYAAFQEDQAFYEKVLEKTALSPEEVTEWQEAAEKMYLPYDKELKINAQDDTFLQKKKWDLDNTPEEQFPLLLNYHPLTLYRYQVCKQADTVLAHFLLDDIEDIDVMKRSYDYYEKVTTHDSSLSYCVFSVMASKFGYQEKAYDYFNKTARLDIDNIHKNTKDGLHMANMGGTWLAIVYGFAGLRIKNGELHLKPQLPEKWEKLSFKLVFRGSLLKIEMSQGGVTYSLEEGEELELFHRGEKLVLNGAKAIYK